MAYEVSFRCGLMRAETSKLRTILRNSELNFYKKIRLIQAYLLSKGTFQCSTWAALSAAFYRRFHGCILGMYRDALGTYHTPMCVNDMYNDDDIIYNNSLIYPNTLIRMNRLLLFVRIVRKILLSLSIVCRKPFWVRSLRPLALKTTSRGLLSLTSFGRVPLSH